MKYWLCVTNSENWEVIKKQKIWGVSKRSRSQIEQVRTGDYLVFYVTPQRIGGIFTASSESFQSDEQIFRWGEFGRYERFPYRVNLEPVVLPKEPAHFKELVQRLKFITYKIKWSVHLRTAMRAISRDDYETILSSLKVKQYNSNLKNERERF